MWKTTFSVAQMDCPAEEQLIRIKLKGIRGVEALAFDIPARSLEVYHEPAILGAITAALETLELGATPVASQSVDVLPASAGEEGERRVLWQVLSVNFSFFVLEILTGFLAGSMGLVADSLDMLADSIVYGLSLFAVGAAAGRKRRVARAAGYFQMTLAVLGFGEVMRRFLGDGDSPRFSLMIIISLLALAGNATCLYLLKKSESREVHMQASMIFTSTDVIVNLGVVVAGGLVYLTRSPLPDLAVGTVVFVLVARGALRILQLAR